MRVLAVAGLAVLTGCATSKEYTSYLAAHQAAHESRATAEKARFDAIAEIAKNSADPAARTAAVMALAMAKSESQVAPPAPPQNEMLQWASVFVPALTNLGANFFTYRLGMVNSNNAAQTTTAAYSAFGSIATAGFNSNATIASHIQAPAANVTTTTNTTNNTSNNTTNNTTSNQTTSNTTSNTTTNNTTTNTTNSNNRTCNGGLGGNGALGGNGGVGGNGTTTGGSGGNGATGGGGAAGGGATC